MIPEIQRCSEEAIRIGTLTRQRNAYRDKLIEAAKTLTDMAFMFEQYGASSGRQLDWGQSQAIARQARRIAEEVTPKRVTLGPGNVSVGGTVFKVEELNVTTESDFDRALLGAVEAPSPQDDNALSKQNKKVHE